MIMKPIVKKSLFEATSVAIITPCVLALMDVVIDHVQPLTFYLIDAGLLFVTIFIVRIILNRKETKR